MDRLRPLREYDMSAEHGFLSPFELDEIALPSLFDPVLAVCEDLPALVASGRLRHFLAERLPLVDLSPFVSSADNAELRAAFVRYGFLAQAHVWGEAAPADILPEAIAVPLVLVADALGQAPILPYSSYILDNWARLDKEGPLVLGNIRMVQGVFGGVDETGFLQVHVAIEAKAGAAMALAGPLIEAAAEGQEDAVIRHLDRLRDIIAEMDAIFGHIPEYCDPYVYFHRVRPYLNGWKNNAALPDGLLYQGVGRFGGERQTLRGATGSQSSILPALDALLGLGHGGDALSQFLGELEAYRPAGHRRFLADVKRMSGVRKLVAERNGEIGVAAYNSCVEELARFRTRHLEYAARYIHAQSGGGAGNDNSVGSGGTDFMVYLKKYRDESRAQLLRRE